MLKIWKVCLDLQKNLISQLENGMFLMLNFLIQCFLVHHHLIRIFQIGKLIKMQIYLIWKIQI